jgi:hypothetical protein
VTLSARWVTLRARWVTLRARWLTLRARWVDAESSRGDAKSSLGDAESSLGDAKRSRGVFAGQLSSIQAGGLLENLMRCHGPHVRAPAGERSEEQPYQFYICAFLACLTQDPSLYTKREGPGRAERIAART